MATEPDQRLTRERRVRKRGHFLHLQNSRRKVRSNHLLVALSARQPLPEGEMEPGESRLGITVTKKVDKRAARRNRLKRWIREFFRKERAYFQERVDVVVIALDGAAELEFPEVCYQLRWALRRAEVLRRP